MDGAHEEPMELDENDAAAGEFDEEGLFDDEDDEGAEDDDGEDGGYGDIPAHDNPMAAAGDVAKAPKKRKRASNEVQLKLLKKFVQTVAKRQPNGGRADLWAHRGGQKSLAKAVKEGRSFYALYQQYARRPLPVATFNRELDQLLRHHDGKCEEAKQKGPCGCFGQHSRRYWRGIDVTLALDELKPLFTEADAECTFEGSDPAAAARALQASLRELELKSPAGAAAPVRTACPGVPAPRRAAARARGSLAREGEAGHAGAAGAAAPRRRRAGAARRRRAAAAAAAGAQDATYARACRAAGRPRPPRGRRAACAASAARFRGGDRKFARRRRCRERAGRQRLHAVVAGRTRAGDAELRRPQV